MKYSILTYIVSSIIIIGMFVMYYFILYSAFNYYIPEWFNQTSSYISIIFMAGFIAMIKLIIISYLIEQLRKIKRLEDKYTQHYDDTFRGGV